MRGPDAPVALSFSLASRTLSCHDVVSKPKTLEIAYFWMQNYPHLTRIRGTQAASLYLRPCKGAHGCGPTRIGFPPSSHFLVSTGPSLTTSLGGRWPRLPSLDNTTDGGAPENRVEEMQELCNALLDGPTVPAAVGIVFEHRVYHLPQEERADTSTSFLWSRARSAVTPLPW